MAQMENDGGREQARSDRQAKEKQDRADKQSERAKEKRDSGSRDREKSKPAPAAKPAATQDNADAKQKADALAKQQQEEQMRLQREAEARQRADQAAAAQAQQLAELRAKQQQYIQELSAQRASMGQDPALMALQQQMTGPSIAQQQMNLQQQNIQQQMLGAAQARGGFNPGATRAALMAGGDAATQMAAQGSIAAAQERQAATNAWAQAFQNRQAGLDALYGQAQQQSYGQGSANAGQQFDANAAVANLAQQQGAMANQNAMGLNAQQVAIDEAAKQRALQWNLGRLDYKQKTEQGQRGIATGILGAAFGTASKAFGMGG